MFLIQGDSLHPDLSNSHQIFFREFPCYLLFSIQCTLHNDVNTFQTHRTWDISSIHCSYVSLMFIYHLFIAWAQTIICGNHSLPNLEIIANVGLLRKGIERDLTTHSQFSILCFEGPGLMCLN